MEIYDSQNEHSLHHRTTYLDSSKNSADMSSSNDEMQDDMETNIDDECNLLTTNKVPSAATIASDHESVWSTTVQMFIPFLLAGFGMVAASLLLDLVQHWPVYKNIPEVYILVPALLGLKGNLEMTLASRLSTQANLGYLDIPKNKWSMIVGNLALIQCQAIVVGFLASLVAVIMGWIPEGEFNIQHGLLLCASSVVTSSMASMLLGLVMVLVILVSRHFHINPDNVATPIAASLGDLTTLALLSWFATILFNEIGQTSWLATTISIIGGLVIPFWAWLASQNPTTQEVLNNGWTPVICAMLISSLGGLILDFTVNKYKGVAVFQLVINGVGGNLVAVQASRLSTDLHSKSCLGQLPPNTLMCINPIKIFCDKGIHAQTARMLLLMVIPGHLIFTYTISFLQAGHTSFTPTFMFVYIFVAMLQVCLLLYIAHVMVLWMWRACIDPDNSAIPYLTAIGDLLGTFLLGIAFQFLYLIGDRDSDVGD